MAKLRACDVREGRKRKLCGLVRKSVTADGFCSLEQQVDRRRLGITFRDNTTFAGSSASVSDSISVFVFGLM